ncbi:hypothetical protein [Streptomyces sp. CO7]
MALEHSWPDGIEVCYRDMWEFRERFPYGYGVLRALSWVGAFRIFSALEEPVVPVRDGYPVGWGWSSRPAATWWTATTVESRWPVGSPPAAGGGRLG